MQHSNYISESRMLTSTKYFTITSSKLNLTEKSENKQKNKGIHAKKKPEEYLEKQKVNIAVERTDC